MKSEFVIWRYKDTPGACALKELRGLDKTYRLNNGTSFAAGFPAGVTVHMDPDSPDDMLLVDNVLNADLVIVASKRLQECVRAYQPACVEYLPVDVIDHKGRIASKDYGIIHPIKPVDAVDKAQSIFEASLLDDDDIDSFERLVLKESAIPGDRHLFRLKGFWNITLVRRSLAEALAKEKFSGLRWLEIDAYPEV